MFVPFAIPCAPLCASVVLSRALRLAGACLAAAGTRSPDALRAVASTAGARGGFGYGNVRGGACPVC